MAREHTRSPVPPCGFRTTVRKLTVLWRHSCVKAARSLWAHRFTTPLRCSPLRCMCFAYVHMLHKPGLSYCCTCLPGIVAPFAAVAGSRLLARPLSLFLSKLVRVGKRALGARKSYGCCVDGRLLYVIAETGWAGYSGRCPADDVVLVPLLRLLQVLFWFYLWSCVFSVSPPLFVLVV